MEQTHGTRQCRTVSGFIWSFGCIFFELMVREMFSPECCLSACRVGIEERLGQVPERADLWESCLGTRAAGHACLAKVDTYDGVANHPWITGTLQWLEGQRLGAQNVLARTGDSVAAPPEPPTTQTAASAAADPPPRVPSKIVAGTTHCVRARRRRGI